MMEIAPQDYLMGVSGNQPPLPLDVTYAWKRMSRRRGELKVWHHRKLIFHGKTDGRPWTAGLVAELLKRGNP